MLRNYLLVAFRNLRKYRVYTAINIIGFSLAMAFSIIAFIHIRHEWTYDGFHRDGDRIYRVYQTVDYPEGARDEAIISGPVGPSLAQTFPSIEDFVRYDSANGVLQYGEQSFSSRGFFADPSLFEIFSFPLLEGDPATALKEPNSIVLGQDIVDRYFDGQAPLGEHIAFRHNGETHRYLVTGLVGPIPENSSIHFDFALPLNSPAAGQIYPEQLTNIHRAGLETYIRLAPGTQPAQLADQLPALAEKLWGQPRKLGLQPLHDIHFDGNIAGKTGTVDLFVFVSTLGGIAALTLLLACLNFAHLSIGLAGRRYTELGVRKVMGAQPLQVMLPFFSEVLLLSLLALVGSIGLVELLLPTYNALAFTNLTLVLDGGTCAALGLLILLNVLLASSYPAFVLAGLRPTQILKNQREASGMGRFGRACILVQFTLSIALIAISLTMSQQSDYLATKNLGFDKEQLVVVRNGSISTLDLFRQELARHPGVIQMGGTSSYSESYLMGVGMGPPDNRFRGRVFAIDHGFIETLGVELLQGRSFSTERAADAQESVLINEAMVEKLGWDTAVGKPLTGFETGMLDDRIPTVVGVVKDFHFASLYREIEPLAFILSPEQVRFLLVRISPEDIPATLNFMRAAWGKIEPDFAFGYTFLDEELGWYYERVEHRQKIIGYAACAAVFIVGMGLVGIASLALNKRTKEIGVRKILGASAGQIVAAVSREFVWLVAAANLAAWPLAYRYVGAWLDDFAYRIDLGLGPFFGAGLTVLATTLAIVSGLALRAARANPVDSLRNE
ncbi:MAG: FtsX-like permease family protein [Candidatus Latescibacteria bacterium]|nr:FtsX-like permease family protein [Candidatus Latescibacterota bacterium]